MEKLVSIVTPCYNGEKFIWRLLNTILDQTYTRIEVFVIDDGSTDNSAKLIQSYIPRFEAKGYSLTYVYQENAGQSEAINRGLKLFTGDYLTWPDCDDFYAENDAIERMVSCLQASSDDVSVLRCSANRLNEKTLAIIGYFEDKLQDKKAISCFKESFLIRKNFWLQPICFMVKSEKFLQYIPTRSIYTNKDAGQNWQLLLPLLYSQKCLIVNKFLCNILVRTESHSRGMYKSYEAIKTRNKAYEDTLYATLDNMPIPASEREKLNDEIKSKYLKIDFDLACKYKKTKEIHDSYIAIKAHNSRLLSSKEKVIHLVIHIPFVLNLWMFTKKIKSVLGWIKRHLKLSLFLISFLISLLANLIFFRVDIYPLLLQKYYQSTTSFLSENITTEDFNKQILEGAKERLSSSFVVDNAIISSDFKTRFKQSFYKKDISVYNYGEYGFLMWFTLQTAIERSDIALCNFIREKFDTAFLAEKTTSIERTDQSVYGCVAMELFKLTNNLKYREIAEHIYNILYSIDNQYGLITYRQDDKQQVDMLGFVCPFLSEYGRFFDNENAKRLSVKIIENYMQYGVDKETGIPAQGYNISAHIKTGYANWGRGMVWYGMALSYADKDLFSDEAKEKTDAFFQTVNMLFDMGKGEISQFPGNSNVADMSATIPLMYFLQKENKLRMTKKDFIKLIAPYVMDNGLIGYNSPTISSHQSVIPNLRHDMTQGVMCLFFNQLKE